MLGSQGEAAAGSCHSRTREPPTASFPEYGWVDLLVAFRAYDVSLNKLGPNAQPLGDHVGDSEERYHGLSGALCGNGALIRRHCLPLVHFMATRSHSPTMVHQPREGPALEPCVTTGKKVSYDLHDHLSAAITGGRGQLPCQLPGGPRDQRAQAESRIGDFLTLRWH